MSGAAVAASTRGILVTLAIAGLACTGSRVTSELAPAGLSRAQVRAAIDSFVRQPEFGNAHWGILIVDPERGDTLYSLNSGKLFMPASNQKLITGAVALARLGPDYRFRTTFLAAGPVRDSVLAGDLLVVGRGDPTVSDQMRGDAMAPLREIADSLSARGIRRIEGDVVGIGNAFPDAIYGYGWAWDDFDYPYSAGVDELLFNEGFSEIIARGGAQAGDSVLVVTKPARDFPQVRVTAITVAPLESAGDLALPTTRLRVERDTTLQPGRGVLVSGTMLPGDSTTLRVAHRDPNGAYRTALIEALGERGIVVAIGSASLAKETRRSAGSSGDLASRMPAVDTLFTMESPPLREILPALQKPSQNQIAEVLLKTLGLEVTGVGTADSGRVVVERQLADWGVLPEGAIVRDGSGLSRHNYVTPATIVRVLDAMRRDSAFTVYLDALPIAGVDGTIARRMRGTPAEGNVRAKTGYIDRARSLSGYVTTYDGRMLIFSFLANNWTTPVRSVESVQDAIAARLAAMSLVPAP